MSPQADEIDVSGPGPAPDGPTFVRGDVAALMARIVAGDNAAVFELLERHATSIGAAVRREARRVGWQPGPADVDELVVDVVLDLVPIAHAWSSDGGALPWNWAWRRLARLVAQHRCQAVDELEDERLSIDAQPLATASDVDWVATLDRVAQSDPLVAGLVAALRRLEARSRGGFDLEGHLEAIVARAERPNDWAGPVALVQGRSVTTVRQRCHRLLMKLDG